jgi:hypothetical protein
MTDDVVRGDPQTVEDGPEYDIDFREHPERYRHTSDEQGAFKVEPYKSELLDNWTISDLEPARQAAETIYEQYRSYREDDDFVGMDMARKYLQMGWTRALRYAKYPGGQKYEDGEQREPQEWYDEEKRDISLVYRDRLDEVRDDDAYQQAKQRHQERYGKS